jgi:sugar/nucleoside kinase (ribokinase family)
MPANQLRYNKPVLNIRPLDPVDYLLIGHITIDETTQGPRLGGTVLYSALAARALGLRVGIVTTWGMELPLDPLDGITVVSYPAERSTTFVNLESPQGRVQTLLYSAPHIDLYHIPEAWRNAAIVHLAPLDQDVEPTLVRSFPTALIGATPQGWLRSWDKDGRVHPSEWPEANFVLQRLGAAIISRHDVGGSEEKIEEFASASRVLAVTDGAEGAVVYWNGDVRRFRAPEVEVIDPTGAGDIFAATFFIRLYLTRDPWEACRLAVQLASISVTRPGLEGIPTHQEIEEHLVEIL